MQKKIIPLLIVIIMASVWTIYRAIVPSYSSVLGANWDINLPAKALCKEVYSKDAGPSFHGDGVRYHIFGYTNSSAIEKMLPWSDINGNTLAWSQIQGEEKRYQTYREATDLWLGELGIPEKQYPDYDACFCWYKNAHDNSEIIIFWNPEIYRLYIIENIV